MKEPLTGEALRQALMAPAVGMTVPGLRGWVSLEPGDAVHIPRWLDAIAQVERTARFTTSDPLKSMQRRRFA